MTDQLQPIAPLGAVEQGCLLFADITGYTKFIDATEITHAQDVIGDLIETMLGVITPTFQLSRVEGDAVFAFADAGGLTPGLVLDTVDSTYFAFRERLRDVVHATTCPCQACRRIPQLDLKFFLHDGEYSVKKVAGFTELSGMDVIVLHRLAKGSAKKVADGHAFAVFTKAIVEEMGLDTTALGLVPNVEEFDDTGPLETWVQDMEMRWVDHEASAAVAIEEENAVHVTAFDTPAAPQVVWHHITDPKKRLLWQPHVTGVIPQGSARTEAGSVNHCMHGEDMTIEHIVTWQPFTRITLSYDTAGVENWHWAYVLEPLDDGGTRLTALIGDPGGDAWARLKPSFAPLMDDLTVRLKELVDAAGS